MNPTTYLHSLLNPKSYANCFPNSFFILLNYLTYSGFALIQKVVGNQIESGRKNSKTLSVNQNWELRPLKIPGSSGPGRRTVFDCDSESTFYAYLNTCGSSTNTWSVHPLTTQLNSHLGWTLIGIQSPSALIQRFFRFQWCSELYQPTLTLTSLVITDSTLKITGQQ